MPGGDGTGPYGTYRNCMPSDEGDSQYFPMGGGRGPCGRGMARGRGRGRGFGPIYSQRISNQEEKAVLEKRKEILEKQLSDIEKILRDKEEKK